MIDSPLGPVTIAPAGLDDLSTVLAIYDDGALFLRSKGFSNAPYPQPGWVRDIVHGDIAAGTVFLCRHQSGRAIGTIRLLWSDRGMWPEGSAEALYVHGLGIRNDVRGHGIGALMLQWAKGYARSHGRQYLRLDCEATNLALRHYYERLGFAFCGERAQARHVGARYELRLDGPSGSSENL